MYVILQRQKKLGSTESRVEKNIPNPSVQRQKNLSTDGKIFWPAKAGKAQICRGRKNGRAINLTRRINCRLEI
jgi:hypothetical protein